MAHNLHNFIDMKPRERLQNNGPWSLNETELLEALLSPGTASMPAWKLSRLLLEKYGSLSNIMGRHPQELTGIPGLGTAKACRLIAALELGRRAMSEKVVGDELTSPQDVFRATKDLALLPFETCVLLIVDSKNRIVLKTSLKQGSEMSCHVDPKRLFSILLTSNRSRFFLVHNHPSGDSTPSTQDIFVTKRILEGCMLLNLQFLDHVVVSKEGYTSIRATYKEFEDLWE